LRILLYEYVTGGGWWEQSPLAPSGSLLAEGEAMARSLATDLLELQHQVVMLRDTRLPTAGSSEISHWSVDSAACQKAVFQQAAAQCDSAIIIAPEFEDRLLERCHWAESQGVSLLSPNASFVAIAADKWESAQRLQHGGAAVPRTAMFDAAIPCWESFPGPVVVKPRYGAGSQAVQLLRTEADRRRFETVAASSKTEWLVQSYCPGEPASVVTLCGPVPAHRYLTPALRQVQGDQFEYLGSEGPLPTDLQDRTARLVEAALAALPPTRGYIGWDIVLGDDSNGCKDVVIEVNPRLTTSFVALRGLFNVAEVMMGIAEAKPVPVRLRAMSIHYRVSEGPSDYPV